MIASPPAEPPAAERRVATWLQPAASGVLFIALAASPAYTVRFHVLALPSTLLEVLLVLGVGLGLAALGRAAPWRNPYTWPALALLAAATLDVFFSPDRRAAAGIWKAYFAEPMLAGVVLAGLAVTRPRARLFLAGLAVAGLVAALANIGADLAAIASHRYSTVTPPVAIFNSANATALYLEPLIAFALAIALFGDDRLERWSAAGFLVIAVPAVLLSFSRGGWLTLVALAVLAALFHPWRGRILAGVGLGVVALMLVPPTRRRVLVEFDPNSADNTISLRLRLWRSALNMLVHNPVFGGGLSGFRRSVEPYRDPLYHEDLIYPHNLLLNFWTETGLVGLAAFVWVAIQMVRSSLRSIAIDPWNRVLGIGVLGVLLAFLVHGMIDAPYFKNDQALAFWALLGIQVGALRPAQAGIIRS